MRILFFTIISFFRDQNFETLPSYLYRLYNGVDSKTRVG